MKRIIYILLVCLAVSVCLCSCVGLTLVDGEGGYNEKAELSVYEQYGDTCSLAERMTG